MPVTTAARTAAPRFRFTFTTLGPCKLLDAAARAQLEDLVEGCAGVIAARPATLGDPLTVADVAAFLERRQAAGAQAARTTLEQIGGAQ